MSKFNESYKEYYRIIEDARSLNRIKIKDRDHSNYEYFESHHVIPKSLGGSNKKSNLVLLTPEEHYICHSLLPDFCEGKSKAKMYHAWNAMNNMNINIGKKILGVKEYSRIRKAYSKNCSGENSLLIKPVFQLDRNSGKIIKKWPGITIAEISLDIINISMCVTGKQKVSYNYCWANEENLEQTIKDIKNGVKSPNTKSKPVIQLNKNTGEIIKKWSLATEAATILGITTSSILSCVRKSRKTANGYCWANEENLEQTIKDIKNGLKTRSQVKKVYQIDKNNKCIKIWPSIKEAELVLKITGVSRCIHGTQKTAGGFRWFNEESTEFFSKDVLNLDTD